MPNSFINYLNTMNNASANNENTLAESQVLSDYYHSIKVDRKLGQVLYNKLFNENEKTSIILTGHAGDGKTSILIQILDKLGYFNDDKKPLKEYEIYEDKFFYVKDMSELKKESQQDILKKFLMYPKKNISSLLVSNTGPLINTFEDILDKESFEKLEVDLIEILDKNELKTVKLNMDGDEYSFIAINMANIDNTYLVKKIFDNILDEKLWIKCRDCINNFQCPIFSNYKLCCESKERIVDILEKIYIWFKESESRLTIRQIMSHLSFALTGNLNCKNIEEKNIDLFDYAFPNLLFGYSGTKFIKESANIKAIRELRKVNLEEKSLFTDYDLFVNEKFDMFKDNARNLLENKLKNTNEYLDTMNIESIMIRRSFRRFYIVMSNVRNYDYEKLISNIFSSAFNLYYNLTCTKNISHKQRSELQDIVFKSLYKSHMGIYPHKEQSNIYLTVNKDFDNIQNVQLILGELPKNDIIIKSKSSKCSFNENEDKYNLYINFMRSKRDIELTFQMLKYFIRINEGELFTSLNPSFSFGLNNIKAELLKYYRYNTYEDYSCIKLLVMKKDKIDILTMIIEDEKIEIK